MKRTYTFFLGVIFSVFAFTSIGIGQTESSGLQETLTKLTGTAGEAYVSPIISAFGSNLNSGWVHKSPASKIFGIDLEVGVVAMATMFGDNNKTFSTSGTFQFNNDQAMTLINNSPETQGLSPAIKDGMANQIAQQEYTVGISGPTLIGKKETEVMVDFSKTNITYEKKTYELKQQSISTGAKGFLGDVSALPLLAPQFSVGTVYGTMATFRFLPSVKVGDLGKFSYFGFGIQHNPSMFIPIPLPVDVSAAFFTQTLKVGDIFKASATTFGLYASKTFSLLGIVSLTPYGGFAIESSSVDVAYDVNYATPVPGVTVPGKVEFTMKGDNSTRLTVGASFKLLLLNISADYSLAKYNAVSVGINFIL